MNKEDELRGVIKRHKRFKGTDLEYQVLHANDPNKIVVNRWYYYGLWLSFILSTINIIFGWIQS